MFFYTCFASAYTLYKVTSKSSNFLQKETIHGLNKFFTDDFYSKIYDPTALLYQRKSDHRFYEVYIDYPELISKYLKEEDIDVIFLTYSLNLKEMIQWKEKHLKFKRLEGFQDVIKWRDRYKRFSEAEALWNLIKWKKEQGEDVDLEDLWNLITEGEGEVVFVNVHQYIYYRAFLFLMEERDFFSGKELIKGFETHIQNPVPETLQKYWYVFLDEENKPISLRGKERNCHERKEKKILLKPWCLYNRKDFLSGFIKQGEKAKRLGLMYLPPPEGVPLKASLRSLFKYK